MAGKTVLVVGQRSNYLPCDSLHRVTECSHDIGMGQWSKTARQKLHYFLYSSLRYTHCIRQILIQCGRETTQWQEVGLIGAHLGDWLPQYVYFIHVLMYFHCDIPLLFSTKSYWVSTMHIDLGTKKNTDFQTKKKTKHPESPVCMCMYWAWGAGKTLFVLLFSRWF